jgi:hypothetical protein
MIPPLSPFEKLVVDHLADAVTALEALRGTLETLADESQPTRAQKVAGSKVDLTVPAWINTSVQGGVMLSNGIS